MNKSKNIFLIIIVLMLFITTSCQKLNTDENMNIIDTRGAGLGDFWYDTSTIQGATEMSKLIILGEITDILDISYENSMDVPDFTYNVKIKKIYFDRDNIYKVDDNIKFNTICGYVKANDLVKAVGDRPRAKKYNYLQETYKDNDYIRFVGFGDMAFEQNKTYILFLDYYNNNPIHLIPATDRQNYEIKDNRASSDCKISTFAESVNNIELEIENAVKNRTGEIDKTYEEYYKNAKD